MAKSSPVPAAAPAPGDLATVPRTRSPNYPIYRIDTAIKKVEALAQEFKRHRVPLADAAKKIGFTSPKSSSAAQAIAALRAYGFLDVHGSGDKRQVAVSEAGHKIVGNHSDRQSLLAKAALAPALHAELFKRFVDKDGIAPDPTLRQYLVYDREEARFNEEVVDTFIRQFKATLRFVGLDTSGRMSEDRGAEHQTEISVGDFVQWESQGAARFPEPRPVTGKSDDGGFVFVEGSPTGLPVDEIRLVEPGNGKAPTMMPANPETPVPQGEIVPPTPPLNPHYKPAVALAGAKQDVFTGQTGDLIVRWPGVVSPDDIEDIEVWLDMLKRKIKRSVKEETQN